MKGEQPSLEAQLVNIADAIAYSTHDIDDGLRVGYLDEKTSSKTFRCTPNTMRKSMRNIRIFRSAASKRKW